MRRSSTSGFFALASLPLVLAACSGAPGSSTAGNPGEGTPQAESVRASRPSDDIGDDTSTAAGPDASVKECKGALPDICEVCANGKTQCAHWVIVDDKCEVQIVPPPASTALPDPSTSAAAGEEAVTKTSVVCPPDEKSCLVELNDGVCSEVCVRDTALCVTPPSCRPVCDPVGDPPMPGCQWDSKTCEWLCV